MNYFRMLGIRICIVCYVFNCAFILSCNKDELGIADKLYSYVVEEVNASLGDTLSTLEMVSLIIPPNAFLEDGEVFLGQTGSEPTSVPNEDLEVVGKPITIKTHTVILRKPLQLSIPIGSSTPVDITNYFIVLYNGKTYFPVEFSMDANQIFVSIDELDWDKTKENIPESFSEIVILALINKQTPSKEEMGLKEISVNGEGKMFYAKPTANSSSKVLLMVHGWLANSSRWINFMQDVNNHENQVYTAYWTFNYNSSWSIEKNAELLNDAIKTYANGAQIDIVAHSMGGLVSRSMLETFQGHSYINRLVTLGTPHLGSPLGVFRNVIGAIVSMENSDNGFLYNYYSQGFRDLDVNSDFIQKMKELEVPPIPYYTIACTNNAQTSYAIVASKMLEGGDDGVVGVTSAKGISNAASPKLDVLINADFAHLEIPDNDLVFDQVMSYLKSDN